MVWRGTRADFALRSFSPHGPGCPPQGESIMASLTDIPPEDLGAQLADMRGLLVQLLDLLTGRAEAPPAPRVGYTVEEAASLMGRSPYTVREWCRHGRIHASKRPEKRGGAELWNVSADEVTRVKNEGLLPLVSNRPTSSS